MARHSDRILTMSDNHECKQMQLIFAAVSISSIVNDIWIKSMHANRNGNGNGNVGNKNARKNTMISYVNQSNQGDSRQQDSKLC